MKWCSIKETLKKDKELRELKNNIIKNLKKILDAPNEKEITILEGLYQNYKSLIDDPFVDDRDYFFQNEYNIKLSTAKIKLGISIDIEFLKKLTGNIDWLNNSLGELSEEEPQDAQDLYDEIIVPNASIIYYEICKISYNEKAYSDVIKYANNLFYLKPYNINILSEYITKDNLSNLYLYFAEAQFYNGDVDNAIKYYDLAIRTQPKSVRNYIQKAISLFKVKDYEKSEKIYYNLLNTKNNFEIEKYKQEIYLNLCKLYIEVKNTTKAKKIFEKLKDNSNNKNELLFLEARIFDIENNFIEAINNYSQINITDSSNTMNKIYMGICMIKSGNAKGYNYIKEGLSLQLADLSINEVPSSLYMYRPINEKTIALIHGQYLLFSEPKDFNDPLDSRFCLEQVHEKEIKNVLSDIKIRCFSSGENAEPLNTLMWAHYAENHTGIAIEYELLPNIVNKLKKEYFFNSINYSQTLVHNMQLIEFQDYVKAFFTKDPYWKYENEYRLLTFKNELEEGYKLSNCIKIKSITFGYKTNNEYKKLIKNIIENQNNDCILYEIVIPNMRVAPFKLKRQLYKF